MATGYIGVPVLSGVTTGSGTANLDGKYPFIAVYITWSSGVTAGAVQVETSDDPAFAGTWSPIGSAQSFVANTKQVVVPTGPSAYKSIRVRVSTTVVGGTVSASISASD